MRKFAGVIAVLLFLGVAAFAISRWRETAVVPEKVLPAIARHLVFELDNAHYSHSQEGRKRWELTAAVARRRKDSPHIELERIDAALYSRTGEETRIAADRGFYQVETGDITLEGAVHITSAEYRITTTGLTYSEAREEIVIDDRVTIEHPRYRIVAADARVRLAENRFEFGGGVSARIGGDVTTGEPEHE
ncbi:MAG: LPS export ABC transporter periplasmic protein LptC [Deltaproteobacteria bacterium]|nr:LPS export ABC transporter periplasmic protein LptC [Candidatus Anaeroferrophillacea bacterium]